MSFNKLHRLAIELKYEGNTYEEISKELGGRFSVNTLNAYFSAEGMLYEPYLAYESRENKKRRDSVQGIFEKQVDKAANILVKAMVKADKEGVTKEAIEYAEKILDRAGIVVGSKVQIKDDREEVWTDEELEDALRREGIDIKTGPTDRTSKKR